MNVLVLVTAGLIDVAAVARDDDMVSRIITGPLVASEPVARLLWEWLREVRGDRLWVLERSS